MIGQVNFTSTNLLQSYATTPVKEANTQPQQEIASEIVSKEAAEAAKIKALVAPKAKTAPEKKSLDEYKTDLIKEGKVEGKDFKVEIGELDSKIIIYKEDKPSKVIRYDKDGKSKDDFEAIQEFSYPIGDNKGLKHIETTYGADGEFHFRTSRYEKENSPYKNELINYTTTAKELSEYFTSKGIKYSKDLDLIGENTVIQKITAYEPDTNNITRYEFSYNKDNKLQDVSKLIINKEGNTEGRITFAEDETSYTEYQDNFKA